MSLFAIPNLIGAHLGGWRHRDAYGPVVMDLQKTIELAQLAERGKLDGLFLADGNGIRDMDKGKACGQLGRAFQHVGGQAGGDRGRRIGAGPEAPVRAFDCAQWGLGVTAQDGGKRTFVARRHS